MKKIISILLCSMMLCGSLSVFAEDGIMPLIDCDHDPIYGTTEETTVTEISECKTKITVKTYCNECGARIDTSVSYDTHHTWVDEIIDGETVKACYYCGAVK